MTQDHNTNLFNIKPINLFWLILIIISSVTYVLMAKFFICTNNPGKRVLYIFIVIICTFISFFSYTKILKSQQLSNTYLFAKVGAVVLVFIFGIFYFGDKMTVKNWIGAIAALVAIVLLM